ncbi:hypothetical protein [Thalassiella azotivora]
MDDAARSGPAGERGRPDGEDPQELPLDPEQMLALLQAERERTAVALNPDPRILFGAWGIAWAVGFLAMWSSASDAAPVRLGEGVAGSVFGALLASAAVVTGVHISRRAAGVRGVSSRVGAMYGWTWFVAFGALFAVMTGAYAQGLDAPTAALLWSGISALVVGALYMAGGAVWQDPVQFGLGLWIVLSGAAGALAGFPSVHLVMAVAGGGGFLAAAAWFAVRGSGGRG